MIPCVFLNRIYMGISILAGGGDPGYRRGEIGFSDVAGEERRFGGQQEKVARDLFFLRREVESDRRLPGIKMRKELVDDRRFRFRALRSGANFFLQAVVPFLERREIGQDKLG